MIYAPGFGGPCSPDALVWLAFAYGRAGRPDDARATALEALALFREADDATGVALTLLDLAFLLNW